MAHMRTQLVFCLVFLLQPQSQAEAQTGAVLHLGDSPAMAQKSGSSVFPLPPGGRR